MDKCPNDDGEKNDLAYEVIQPYASYVAIAFVLLFFLVVILSKLVLNADTKMHKSDLVLFNNANNKRLETLMARQASNSAAMQNVHSAVALGLMQPPPNYKPPSSTKPDTISSLNDVHLDQINEPKRVKKNKF